MTLDFTGLACGVEMDAWMALFQGDGFSELAYWDWGAVACKVAARRRSFPSLYRGSAISRMSTRRAGNTCWCPRGAWDCINIKCTAALGKDMHVIPPHTILILKGMHHSRHVEVVQAQDA